MLSRNNIYDISFELLRTEIGKRLWEGVCEPRAEHDDELYKIRVSNETGAQRRVFDV
jgi:hypothetical protein